MEDEQKPLPKDLQLMGYILVNKVENFVSDLKNIQELKHGNRRGIFIVKYDDVENKCDTTFIEPEDFEKYFVGGILTYLNRASQIISPYVGFILVIVDPQQPNYTVTDNFKWNGERIDSIK